MFADHYTQGQHRMKFKLPHRIGLARLSILGVLVGIIAGAGAVIFRDLIGLIHNVAFLGEFSIEYDANRFTPQSPWGAFIIVVPALGSFIVTFLVEKFAPEARGHGVPEVIDAIYYREGVIRPVVGVVKSLASAVSIGTGGGQSDAKGRLPRSAPPSAPGSGRLSGWRHGNASRWWLLVPALASLRLSTRQLAG
jgi:hypothetical protein